MKFRATLHLQWIRIKRLWQNQDQQLALFYHKLSLNITVLPFSQYCNKVLHTWRGLESFFGKSDKRKGAESLLIWPKYIKDKWHGKKQCMHCLIYKTQQVMIKLKSSNSSNFKTSVILQLSVFKFFLTLN